jgi:Dna[CI] antecedent, DciA
MFFTPPRSPCYDALMSQSAAALERLRALQARRARPEPRWGIGALVAAVEKDERRRQKSLGAIAELWDELTPRELALRTRLATFRGGVLTVHVESASVRYDLDRALRDGLEAALRTGCAATLTRVKVIVRAFD